MTDGTEAQAVIGVEILCRIFNVSDFRGAIRNRVALCNLLRCETSWILQRPEYRL